MSLIEWLPSASVVAGMAELKKDWTLTPEALGRLLAWLGDDSGVEQYIVVRRRVTNYFERKNCLYPDELADETLNRIARKLEEKGEITNVSALHYCYIGRLSNHSFHENAGSRRRL